MERASLDTSQDQDSEFPEDPPKLEKEELLYTSRQDNWIVPEASTIEVEPSSPRPSQTRQLFWRPKIQSFEEQLLLNDDEDDHNDGLNLGSSILFDDNMKRQSNERKHIDDDDEEVPSDSNSELLIVRHKKSSYMVRFAIADMLANNPHPTAFEMNQLAEHYSTRYKTVFETMERKRISKNILCERGDNCERIRSYFNREYELLLWPDMSPELTQVLESLLEAHILSRKRLDLGYVHVIMEKTNLSPAVIRASHTKWRQRLLSQGFENYTIKDWKRDNEDSESPAVVFTIEALRKLEEAYLAKKYECIDKEWSSQEISALSHQLGRVPENNIIKWINERNAVAQGALNDVISRKKIIQSGQIWNNRKIPSHKFKRLEKEFANNERPTRWEFAKLARDLEMNETTVRGFYQKKRNHAKRGANWEAARLEVMRLAPDQLQTLEKVAEDKKKTSFEKMEWANKIGISYRTLCSFIEWKRSLKSVARSRYDAI